MNNPTLSPMSIEEEEGGPLCTWLSASYAGRTSQGRMGNTLIIYSLMQGLPFTMPRLGEEDEALQHFRIVRFGGYMVTNGWPPTLFTSKQSVRSDPQKTHRSVVPFRAMVLFFRTGNHRAALPLLTKNAIAIKENVK